MKRRVYESLRGFSVDPLPWSYWRVWLAERFHWQLDYIDALPVEDVYEVIEMINAADTAAAHNRIQ
jgi:hypothetical protein